MMRRRWTGKGAVSGFTLFELAISVAVIGILIAVLIGRLDFYTREAERLTYAQTLTTLRAAVQLKAFELMLSGRQDQVASLAGQNPFRWLDQYPANYLGALTSPDLKKLPLSHWYFDRNDKKLVYLLDKRNTFDPTGSELLKFKVSLLKVSASDSVSGTGLVLLPEDGFEKRPQ